QKWLDAAAPKGSSEISATSGTKLDTTAQVVAIRPTDVKRGSSLQVIAAKPDGSFEPLLWIYNYNPAFQRTYYFKKPESLPAGTEIQMSPSDASKIALFATGQKKSARASPGAR